AADGKPLKLDVQHAHIAVHVVPSLEHAESWTPVLTPPHRGWSPSNSEAQRHVGRVSHSSAPSGVPCDASIPFQRLNRFASTASDRGPRCSTESVSAWDAAAGTAR